MNILFVLSSLVSQMNPPHHSVWDMAFVDSIGTITHDSAFMYNNHGLAYNGAEIWRGPLTGDCTASAGSEVVTCAGIAAASGAIASLSSTVGTQATHLSAIDAQITALQSTGSEPTHAGSTVVAPSGYVGQFIEACVARSSAVSISGTTVIATLPVPPGDWLINASANLSGSLVGTGVVAGLGVGTSTMPSNANNGGDRSEISLVANVNADVTQSIVARHKTFTSTTNVNLLMSAGISLGTPAGAGCVSALRIH